MSGPDGAAGPGGVDDLSSSLAEWVAELADRLKAGETMDLEAYARSHPGRVEQLQGLLPTIASIADLPTSLARGTDWISPRGDHAGVGAEDLGDFQILRELGRGGMGVVYEAVQLSLHRRVALKVLPLAAAMDARLLQRFQLEVQAVASLSHPNIVPIYSVGRDRGVPYFAMQLIDGQNLAEVVRELRHGGPADAGAVTRSLVAGGFAPVQDTVCVAVEPARDPEPVPEPVNRARSDPSNSSIRGGAYFRTVALLGRQAAEAMAHAHELGVLHRDIKPANLLVDARGHLWVTDFGLARLQGDSELTRSGDLVGTLRYMSPEQALGRRAQVDHRTDVYSLGATLYELLTLRPPLEGDDRQALLQRIAREEPIPPRRHNPAVPADLEAIARKAMAKEPADRYATARDLAEDLGRFLAGQPILGRPIGPWARVRRWAVQPRRARDAGVLAMAYGTLFLAWTLLGVVLILMGAMPLPERPGEFVRDLALTSLGDLVPAALLGWQTWRGRTWALRAGSVLALLRVLAQVRSFLGFTPQFGGYYDDPRFRSMMLGLMITLSVIILGAHLIGLVASRVDRETLRT